LRGAQHTPWQGRIDSGPNWPEAKQRSGQALVTYSIRSSWASRSRPIRTGRPRPAKYPASLRELHRVNGWTGFSGRVLAAATTTSMSPSLIRRGRPPARRGSSVPDADAMMIIARRTRTDPCSPRRTICSSRRPS
jgi:hypothetical protein